MEFLSNLFKFVTDSSNKFSHKALTVIVGVVLILLLDNLFGFSFYYNIEKKLNLVTQTNAVLRDKTISHKDSLQLVTLRTGILQVKSIKDRIWDYLTGTDVSVKTKDAQTTNATIKRNYLLHYISASCFLILLMIVLPFVTLTSKEHSLVVNVFILVVSEGILYFCSLGASRLLSFVPILFNQPIFNYFLNILVNIAVVSIFYLVGKYKEA